MSDEHRRHEADSAARETHTAASESAPASLPDESGRPQARCDSGDSGGWGGPGGPPTGPLPRLRRPEAATTEAGTTGPSDHGPSDHGGRTTPPPAPSGTGAHVTYADPNRYGTAGAPTESTDLDVPAPAETTAAPDPASVPYSHAHPSSSTPGDTAEPSGMSAMFDVSFATRATRSLAPVAYVVIVLYLFLDLVGDIYTYSSDTANFGPGALAGVLVLITVGVFRVIALVFLTRFALEACVNLADLAERRAPRA